jgi:hypothetical protein
MRGFEADVPAVVKALTPDGPWRATVEFTPADWTAATDAANELASGLPPDSASNAARLVAAARILYDRDPSKSYNQPILTHTKTLIEPGTRGEVHPPEPGDGKAWFHDFRRWINPQT